LGQEGKSAFFLWRTKGGVILAYKGGIKISDVGMDSYHFPRQPERRKIRKGSQTSKGGDQEILLSSTLREKKGGCGHRTTMEEGRRRKLQQRKLAE